MTIDEVISRLEELKVEHGNIEVEFLESGYSIPIGTIDYIKESKCILARNVILIDM